MAEHTVKSFDGEIGQLRGLIAEMGGLAEVGIADAIRALVTHDEELAKKVVEADHRIDALEAEVDRLAVRTIALRAPMADDLRDVIAALKISGVIERIGDYAKNIAKRVGSIERQSRFERFEAPLWRWRRLALNHGIGSVAISPAPKNVAHSVCHSDAQIRHDRVSCIGIALSH